MKNKTTRVLSFIVGVCLLFYGVYELYMVFGGNAEKADKKARTNAVSIGDTVANENGVEFCVTSMSDSNSIQGDFSEYTTENNFVILSIKVNNGSDESFYVSNSYFVLLEGEKEYEGDLDATMMFDNPLFMDDLNPGLSKEYTIVYETPFKSSEKELKLQIRENMFKDDNYVYINLF